MLSPIPSISKDCPRDLLVELYIQVTTISWLSVRSVQRSTQPQPSRVESSLNIFDYLPSWSEVVTRAGHLPPEKEEVVETRAEERIRRALELEANNSKARARLALNKILRSITIKSYQSLINCNGVQALGIEESFS